MKTLNTLTKALTAAVVALALTACASSSEQTKTDAPPAEVELAVVHDPAPSVATVTVTRVYIDPTITGACGVPSARAWFDYDSAQVESEAKDRLRDIAICLTEGPLAGRSVEIVGHTDPRGSESYNKELGAERADNVARWLNHCGVPETRMTTRSRGEQLATEDMPAIWEFDRRVDIRLVDETGS